MKDAKKTGADKKTDGDKKPDKIPDGAPSKYLRFKNQSNVELQGTKGLVDPNGTFTVEMWVRFDGPGSHILLGDESWPGAGETVSRTTGWVLRLGRGLPGPLDFNNPRAHVR